MSNLTSALAQVVLDQEEVLAQVLSLLQRLDLIDSRLETGLNSVVSLLSLDSTLLYVVLVLTIIAVLILATPPKIRELMPFR